MKENLKTIKLMGRESLNEMMVSCIAANGKMGKSMDTESLSGQMDATMMGNL